MGPPDDPQNVAAADGDELRLGDETGRTAYPVHEYLEAAVEKQQEQTAQAESPPERLPLVIGVFDFPWRLGTLGSLIPMSLLWINAAGMSSVLFIWGFDAGMMGVRALAPAVCMAAVFALAYSSACCLRVVQETADGRGSIDEWPHMLDWKEWTWGMVFVLALAAESGVAALMLTFWSGPLLWIPTVFLAAAFFPFVLIASLEADVWFPSSPKTFNTLKTHLPLWLVFYAEYLGVLLLVCGISALLMYVMPWWSLLVICPLMSATMLLEARLIGRLVCCFGEPEKQGTQKKKKKENRCDRLFSC